MYHYTFPARVYEWTVDHQWFVDAGKGFPKTALNRTVADNRGSPIVPTANFLELESSRLLGTGRDFQNGRFVNEGGAAEAQVYLDSTANSRLYLFRRKKMFPWKISSLATLRDPC